MEPSNVLMMIVIVPSAIWVLVDAVRLGVRRGVIGERYFADLGIVTWVLVVVLVWIVGFPSYLVTRPRYVALRREFPTGRLPRADTREMKAMQAASRQMQAASFQMQAAARQMSETDPLRDVAKAGWFPDASGTTLPGTLRWWDGHAWTADLHPGAS